ncbi:hypothetical protein SHKM778_68620 [Streptomyces sp. KM77-8]|uniref:NAD(P)-dependent oxidoreductase n=1 Tax=Streptomyces haneummycinicus TaxID=3074435 RepID=A0AAT9HS64_9ACTN
MSTRSSTSRASPWSPRSRRSSGPISRARTTCTRPPARRGPPYRLRLLQPRRRLHPRPGDGDPLIPVETPRRPDTYYGLSKCFGEDLAQLYWEKHGIETVSVRIGSCFPEPTSVRMLSIWMSPADGARLFHAALTAENVGHTVVNGSSQNTRQWLDLTSARALGYEPQDDSEQYAGKLIAEQGELDPDNPAHSSLGGPFLTDPPVWPY